MSDNSLEDMCVYVAQIRELLDEVAAYFDEEYGPGQCDCDESVGITSCLVCRVRSEAHLN